MQFDEAMNRFGGDADTVASNLANMEMALAKVAIESNIDLMFKIAVVNEEGFSVMRDDMTPVDQILEHVHGTVDQGVVLATIATFPGRVAVLDDEEMSMMSESDDFSGTASRIMSENEYEKVRDVVICCIQYNSGGQGKALLMMANVTEKPTGGRTLGSVEIANFKDGEDVPIRGDFIFDSSKFAEFPLN